MAISEREVQNKHNSSGELTGRAGVVYDVNIKYTSGGRKKTHSKKGFPTKKEAQQYEAAMHSKLVNPSYIPPGLAFYHNRPALWAQNLLDGFRFGFKDLDPL